MNKVTTNNSGPRAIAESLAVWRDFINRNLIHLRGSGDPSVAAESDRFVVYIADRPHAGAEFALRQCVSKLGSGWGVQVFVPGEGQELLSSIVARWSGLSLERLDDQFFDGHHLDRNRLLRSAAFWDHVRGDIQLFIDGDTVILNGEVTPFLEYDFVAPLWGENRVSPWCTFGNGHLSLRRACAMREIMASCNTYPWLVPDEGIFYALITRLERNRYRIPDDEVAARFAVERVYHPEPFALHKAWRFIEAPRLALLLGEA